jgi:hypothetical protein
VVSLDPAARRACVRKKRHDEGARLPWTGSDILPTGFQCGVLDGQHRQHDPPEATCLPLLLIECSYTSAGRRTRCRDTRAC